MKKHILLLAGCALIFASCGNNNQQAQTQAQIDSTVNAKLAQHDADNAAKNDSTLKAMEKEKAEAMNRERHEERKHEENNNTAPAQANTQATPAPQQAAPPPPPSGLKGHSDQSQQNNNANAPQGGGLKAHSDQNQGR